MGQYIPSLKKEGGEGFTDNVLTETPNTNTWAAVAPQTNKYRLHDAIV